MASSLRHRALTLLEILLALGLLVIAVLTVMALFGLGLKLSSQNRDAVAATQIASSLLEHLVDGTVPLPKVSTRFDGNLPTPPLAGFPSASYYPKVTVGSTDYTVSVQTDPHPGLPKCTLVRVEVQWGQAHRVHLTSAFYRE